MTGPRYGNPGGFGGAYDEPTTGEFQPGLEEAPEDPNEGRLGAHMVCALMRSAHMTVNAQMSTARMHAAMMRPAARHYDPQMRPLG